MNGKSYSSKANSNITSSNDESQQNWAETADNAAKRAEEKLDEIKRSAKEQVGVRNVNLK